MISCFVLLGTIQVAENKPFSSVREVIQNDTLFTKTFVTESELNLYIAQELNLTETISFSDRQEVDSLHKLLNETKQLLISKENLIKFLGFSVASPPSKQVMAQTVNFEPKNRTQRLSLEVNQGDALSLTYEVEKGFGSAAHIEVLLNQVRVAQSASSKRGKNIKLEFEASETGLVELVLRDNGLFKEEGNLKVEVKPRTAHVMVKKIRKIEIQKELVDTIVGDTVFQTIVDEQVLLTHRANLKGNALVVKQLDFDDDNEVLGFAVFFFPNSEQEKLQFSRRETYREDPLEDFSLKELIGKSFTYLPEFTFPELSLSVSDAQQRLIWSNGKVQTSGDWRVSPNSKINYAFFQPRESIAKNSVQLKFSNTSDLYDVDFRLKIMTLILKKFILKQELDVEKFEETILITLI